MGERLASQLLWFEMCLSAHLIVSSPAFLSSIDFAFLAISDSMLKVLGNHGLNNIVQRRKARGFVTDGVSIFDLSEPQEGGRRILGPANEMSRSLSSIAAISREKALLSNIMSESYSDMSHESAEVTFTKACLSKRLQK